MIQKKIVDQKIKEFEIKEYVMQNLRGAGLSDVKLLVTPLGEKIVINASRPGMVVGRKGQYIRKLTNTLKKRFNLENPQIEIGEVSDANLDARIVAERIANTLERYGINRFKGIGHKTMEDAMNAGARGVEIIISGKVPSSRAKRWRFYQGYLKKCGDIADNQVREAFTQALLKTGTIGIQVRIMTKDVKLPDDIKLEKTVVEGAQATTEHKEEKADQQKKDEKSAEKENSGEKKPKSRSRKKKKDETGADAAAEDTAAESNAGEDAGGKK
jgi:small subunit ribosomal protein S3